MTELVTRKTLEEELNKLVGKGDENIYQTENVLIEHGVNYKVVDSSWKSEGKYELGTLILKITGGVNREDFEVEDGEDIFIISNGSRSGDYYTDYYHFFDDYSICKKIQKTIVVDSYESI